MSSPQAAPKQSVSGVEDPGSQNATGELLFSGAEVTHFPTVFIKCITANGIRPVSNLPSGRGHAGVVKVDKVGLKMF